MKLKNTFIKLGSLIALWSISIAASAQSANFKEWKEGNATEQAAALFDGIFMVSSIAGVIVILGGLFAWLMLATDKAPQQLQQVGMKAVWTSLIIGSFMVALTWFVDFVSGTGTGAGKDEDTWQKLRSGSLHIEMPKNISPIQFV